MVVIACYKPAFLTRGNFIFQIIAKNKGLKWKDFKRLGHLQETLGVSLKDMDSLVKEIIHAEPYSKQEICDILGVTAEELAETSLSPNTLTGSWGVRPSICCTAVASSVDLDQSAPKEQSYKSLHCLRAIS